MAFDPDAYLAEFDRAPPPSGGAGGFDPDAYLAEHDKPAAEPKRDVSKLESAAHGAVQGASLGFFDEVMGVVGWGLGMSYKGTRDMYRKLDKEAKEANPKSHLAGAIGGGVATAFVPGLGLARAASATGAAARGAAVGGAAGLGSSEEASISGQAADAATGAVVGGALGAAANKIASAVSRAPARADERLLREIGTGARPTAYQKLAQNKDAAVEAARKHGLDKVARESSELSTAVNAPKSAAGRVIGDAYKAVDQAAPDGIPTSNLRVALTNLATSLERNPNNIPVRGAIAREIRHIEREFGERASAADVHRYVSGLGKKVWGDGKLTPSASGEIKDMIKGAVSDELDKHVRSVADASDDLAKLVPTLEGAKREYGALSDIARAARQRTLKEQGRDAPARPWRQVAKDAASAAVRPADNVLAALVKRAQSGNEQAIAILRRLYASGEQTAAAQSPDIPAGVIGGAAGALLY